MRSACRSRSGRRPRAASCANFRMVKAEPSIASGGMIALTREPSASRGVDHRRRLVDPAPDLRHDAVDDLAESFLRREPCVRPMQPAGAFDVDRLIGVHHDLGDRRVGQERLDRAAIRALRRPAGRRGRCAPLRSAERARSRAPSPVRLRCRCAARRASAMRRTTGRRAGAPARRARALSAARTDRGAPLSSSRALHPAAVLDSALHARRVPSSPASRPACFMRALSFMTAPPSISATNGCERAWWPMPVRTAARVATSASANTGTTVAAASRGSPWFTETGTSRELGMETATGIPTLASTSLTGSPTRASARLTTKCRVGSVTPMTSSDSSSFRVARTLGTSVEASTTMSVQSSSAASVPSSNPEPVSMTT